jgi:hypothetical protein
MRVTQTLGHEPVYTAPDKFVARIAEQLFRLRVDENDQTVPVGHDHRVRRSFHDLPEEFMSQAA